MAELTDADWDDLVRDLTARVAVFAPDWTEHNDSDPGVTIVELFAFLTESLLYRQDRSPRGRARLREIVEQLERAHASRCPDGTLVRNRYYTGKLLSAADFEQEQQYLRAKHRRHNRLLHGVGIVSGLDVSVETGQAGEEPVVVVSPGLAINEEGEELVLCERATSDVCLGSRGLLRHGATGGAADERRRRRRGVADRGDARRSRWSRTSPRVVLAIARLTRDGDTWQPDASFEPVRVGR